LQQLSGSLDPHKYTMLAKCRSDSWNRRFIFTYFNCSESKSPSSIEILFHLRRVLETNFVFESLHHLRHAQNFAWGGSESINRPPNYFWVWNSLLK